MKILHCDLRGVGEIIHLKKALQNHFKNVLKFHSILNALFFAISSLTIIITFHNIFRIFVCVNNKKKIMKKNNSIM